MFERTNEAIRKRYDLLASLYDVDDIIFMGYKQKLRKKAIKLAKVKRGKRVLDVMVGTGDTTLLAARKGAEVVGVDFSGSMMKVAKRKIRKEGLKKVSFVRSDASNLPFKDNSFDTVVCTFGLDTVRVPGPVVGEMVRVAKEGAPVIAAHKSVPSRKLTYILDFPMKIYFKLIWKCGRVELSETFMKKGLKGVREWPYLDMGKVTFGIKQKSPNSMREI